MVKKSAAPDNCAVLIAAPDLLLALKPLAAQGASELLSFSDADALHALEVITKRRPKLVTLERLFAATPRGAALIDRIKADPSLLHSEIRVVSHGAGSPSVLAQPDAGGGAGSVSGSAVATAAAPAGVAPLDQRGTRRAQRFRIAAAVQVMIDGNASTFVDLSTVGAQVLTASALKPNQRVRVAFSDEAATVRLKASVVWAKFERPSGRGPQYRAGLDFVSPNHAALEAYCERHKA